MSSCVLVKHSSAQLLQDAVALIMSSVWLLFLPKALSCAFVNEEGIVVSAGQG